MFPLAVVLVLAGAPAADSLASSPEVSTRLVSPLRERLTAGGVVLTDGKSVASVRIALQRVREPRVDPNAEFMSVGPIGAALPAPAPSRVGSFALSMEPSRRRLRVTISRCERSVWLTIDEIVTGRADSRSLAAQYGINPFGLGLWEALQGVRRVSGPDPTGSPIEWLSPTSFSWTTRADTLVFEQEADSLFQVTLRPRLR